MPARLRRASAQIARLMVAAVVTCVVANAWAPGILYLTAPLTALLAVQASTVGTLRMGLVRVGAVLTGVQVSVVVASVVGLAWWSLAGVIAASMVLAKVLRLGEQTLEAPISAMLILAVSSPGLAAEVRIVNTLIGTVVGIARSQAALLDEVARTLASRARHPDEMKASRPSCGAPSCSATRRRGYGGSPTWSTRSTARGRPTGRTRR